MWNVSSGSGTSVLTITRYGPGGITAPGALAVRMRAVAEHDLERAVRVDVQRQLGVRGAEALRADRSGERGQRHEGGGEPEPMRNGAHS